MLYSCLKAYCCGAAAYMTLPASQYSVLDAKQIERIDDSTFRCYVGGLRFLGFTIDPVLTVSVDVTEKGPTVRLLSTKVRFWRHSQLWSCSRLFHSIPAP